jgi:hypothetical protein
MSLDIKKVYVDTRWRTSDSKSSTDFSIELPRSFTIPDNVVAYIDDIVLPVSFPTVDEKHNILHFQMNEYYGKIIMDVKNYNGQTFSETLKKKLNAYAVSKAYVENATDEAFDVTYDFYDNSILITPKIVITVNFISDQDMIDGVVLSNMSNPNSIARILQLYKSKVFTKTAPFYTLLDLHTTRNLYLTSSALGAYNSISNFGNDTIIKKIPIRAGFNELLYHDSGSGFDYLDVTPRTLRYIDFKLVNAYFEDIDLRGNHWSFSIIFAQK